MALRSCYKDVLPFTALVAAECTNVGVNTLFKAATLKGMSYYVFMVYTYGFATLILLPWLFIFRSTAVLPSIKFPLIFRSCLLALIGFLAQICGYKGVEYSSPTLASAISNLTPAFTFILAIAFRGCDNGQQLQTKCYASPAFMALSFFFAIFTWMERLALRSSSTKAKIIGTIVSMAGALLVVLYKGPTILSTPFPTPSISLQWPLHSSQSDWISGGLLFAAQYLLFSFWYIIQTQIMEIYPSELVVAFFYNLCVTIISAPVCSIAERNLGAWRLRPDIALVAIVYTAFFGSIFSTIVHSWGLRLKGPVYIAMFKPLSIAIAAAMGGIFLGDSLHLGSVVGAIIISIGFYAVIWGKANEEKCEDCGFSSMGASSSHKIPLLQSHKVEEM